MQELYLLPAAGLYAYRTFSVERQIANDTVALLDADEVL